MKIVKLLSVVLVIVSFVLPVKAQKYYDYRIFGDVYNGLPVKIHRQCKYFDIDDIIEFKDGKQVLKAYYPFTDSDQKYDAKGRLIFRKTSPNTSVEYEWFDSNFPQKSIHRSGNDMNIVTYNWFGNYVKSEKFGTKEHTFTYEEFDSYGNWTKRKEKQYTTQYETTRQITYDRPKPDNYLTVVDDRGAMPGAVVEVCDGTGKPLPFIKKFVTDINGQVKNLPWRVNTKYRISYAGYNTAIVDGNAPNQKVYMSK